MKRSDMVKSLASILIVETLDYIPPGLAFHKAQNIADILLERLEDENMLPPPYALPKLPGDNISAQFLCYKWESETGN